MKKAASKAARHRSNPSVPGSLWRDAAALAARKHQSQFRKDGRTPYFAHVVRVAMTISQVFGCQDEETLAAALLHDLIEDTTTDYEDIADCFGESVAAMVASLTKNMMLPEPEREREYDARIALADWRVRLIKLADAFDNLADSANDPDRSRNMEKRLEACRRAIKLASVDVGGHAESRNAIKAVQSLMRTYGKSRQ